MKTSKGRSMTREGLHRADVVVIGCVPYPRRMIRTTSALIERLTRPRSEQRSMSVQSEADCAAFSKQASVRQSGVESWIAGTAQPGVEPDGPSARGLTPRRSTDKWRVEAVLAFRVRVNRKKLATAGLAGGHVLSAIFASVVRRATRRSWAADRPFRRKELTFSLGGMVTHRDGAHEHVDWAYLNLKSGDTVTLKVIETKHVDPQLASAKDRRAHNRGIGTPRPEAPSKKYSSRGRQPGPWMSRRYKHFERLAAMETELYSRLRAALDWVVRE